MVKRSGKKYRNKAEKEYYHELPPTKKNNNNNRRENGKMKFILIKQHIYQHTNKHFKGDEMTRAHLAFYFQCSH